MADAVLEVPATVYTSADRYADEVDVLFLDHPQVLCLSGAVPDPGSYLTVDICGTPVLVTRAKDGRVRAMANICRHRGVRVVDGCGTRPPLHLPVPRLGLRHSRAPSSACRWPTPSRACAARRRVSSTSRSPRATAWWSDGCVPGHPVDIDEYLGPGAGRGARTARLRRLDALRRTARPHGRRQLEGHPRHLPRELPLRLPPPRHARELCLRRGPHLRRLRAATSATARPSARSTSSGIVPEEEWGDVAAHFSYQYSLFPEHQPDVRQPPHRAVADPPRRASTVPRWCTPTYLRPGLSDEEHGQAGRDGAVDLRDRRRRRGLLGRRPHRARHPHRPARHGGLRPERAGAAAPAPRLRRRPRRLAAPISTPEHSGQDVLGPLEELRREERPASEQRLALAGRGPPDDRATRCRPTAARPAGRSGARRPPPPTSPGDGSGRSRRCGTPASGSSSAAARRDGRPGTTSSPHGQYTSIHRSIVCDELAGSMAEHPVPVGGVAFEHLLPLRELDHRLHARRSTRRGSIRCSSGTPRPIRPRTPPLIHHTASAGATSGCRAAVRSETRDPPDPPAITAGARSSCAQQPGERVGLHLGLGRPVEAHVRLAGVRTIPDQDPVARVGERLGQLADTAVVLAEPPAGGDDPGAAVTDQVVGDRPVHSPLRWAWR